MEQQESIHDLMPREVDTVTTNSVDIRDSDYTPIHTPEEEHIENMEETKWDVKHLPKHTYVVDLRPDCLPKEIIPAAKEEPKAYATMMAIGLISMVFVTTAHHIFGGRRCL